MCPACYINGFLFLIFGASGAAIASNPLCDFYSCYINFGRILLDVEGMEKKEQRQGNEKC